MAGPRVLFIDIETAPILGYTWGRFEQNVVGVERDTYMLSFAVKWEGQERVKTYALPDYPGYSRNKENDKKLVADLWKLMDEADVIIAHNGDSFDIKKSNARFLTHGFRPYAPIKSIDTLKIARKYFKFDSNKLDELGRYLGVGRKLPHTGFHLWRGCMAGDEKSWRTMRRYNAQDVRLLERVYLKLRAWHTTHPDLTVYSGHAGCPACQSTQILRRGFIVAKSRKRQRFQCSACGSWFAGRTVELTDEANQKGAKAQARTKAFYR